MSMVVLYSIPLSILGDWLNALNTSDGVRGRSAVCVLLLKLRMKLAGDSL